MGSIYDFPHGRGPRPPMKPGMCPPPQPPHKPHPGPKPPKPVPPCTPMPMPPHCPDPHGFIFPYNKVCFKNYDEAYASLKNKKLLAGEVAYSYYFDKTAEFGINAIMAVGSVKVGAANIIFDNAQKIENAIADITLTLLSNNEKVDSFQDALDQLQDKLDNVDKTDSSINDISNNIDNIIQQNSSINERIDDIDELMLQINQFIEEHTEFANNLSMGLTQVQTDLIDISTKLASIDNVQNEVNDVEDKLQETIDNINRNFITIVDASIEHNTIRRELKSEITEVNTSLNALIQTTKNEFDMALNSLGTELNSFKYDVSINLSALEKKITQNNSSVYDRVDVIVSENIDDLSTDISYKLSDVSNRIHGVEDKVSDVSRYAYDLTTMLENRINSSIDTVLIDVKNASTEIWNELDRQRTFILSNHTEFTDDMNSKLNTTASTLSEYCDSSVATLKRSFTNSLNELEDQFATLKRSFETYKALVQNDLDTKFSDMGIDNRSYTNQQISEERKHNAETYQRKDEAPKTLTNGSGILITNNQISLNIDANGVLYFAGRRYQLTEI